MTIIVKHTWIEGRTAFEVPVDVCENTGRPRPRLPKGFTWTAYYSPGQARVCVAATEPLARYLAERDYAECLGEVEYHSHGADFYEWRPGLSRVAQLIEAVRKQITSFTSRSLPSVVTLTGD